MGEDCQRAGAIEQQAEALRLLTSLFHEARRDLSHRYSEPLRDAIASYLADVTTHAPAIGFDPQKGFDNLCLRQVDQTYGFEQLSGGMREQLSAALRLAMAEVLKPSFDDTLPLVFDDAFTAADPARLEGVLRMLAARSGSGDPDHSVVVQPGRLRIIDGSGRHGGAVGNVWHGSSLCANALRRAAGPPAGRAPARFDHSSSSSTWLPDGSQANLLAAQLDFEFISGIQIQHGGVGLADQKIAIALDSGHITELAPTLTHLAGGPQVDTFRFQQGLVESREVQPLSAVLLGGHVTASPDDVRLAHIAKFLDLGQQF
jgi:hypothetical protein